jgi:hypothetical protein
LKKAFLDSSLEKITGQKVSMMFKKGDYINYTTTYDSNPTKGNISRVGNMKLYIQNENDTIDTSIYYYFIEYIQLIDLK